MPVFERAVAAVAALYCSIAIGLGAYAAHGAAEASAIRLERASLYLILHGIAVTALAVSRPPSLLNRSVCGLLLLGTALFSGSLTGSALAGWPTAAAPLGGIMLIGGWLLAAFAMLRRSI